MSLSRRSKSRVTCLFFALLTLIFVSRSFAKDRSITLVQKASLPGRYEAALSATSAVVDAVIYLRSSEPLPAPDAYIKNPENPFETLEFRSYSVNLRPIQAVSLTGGAISVSGLPARAKNPFFSLTVPSYTPIIPYRGTIIRNGSGLDTGNIAIEYMPDKWKIAAAGDPVAKLAEPAWFLVSHFFDIGCHPDTSRSATLFGGAHRLPAKECTSWFSDEPFLPEATLYVPGAELAFESPRITASATALGSTGDFRKNGSCIRADCSVSGDFISVSAGFASSSRDFIPLDGRQESFLRRMFVAPSFFFTPGRKASRRNKKSGWIIETGGIVIKDLQRGDKYYDPDIPSTTTGFRLSVSNAFASIGFRMMKKPDETDLSGRIIVSLPKRIPLTVESEAKTELKAGKTDNYRAERIAATAGIVWSPQPRIKKFDGKTRNSGIELGLSGKIERSSFGADFVHGTEARLAFDLSESHFHAKILITAAVSDGKEPYSGGIRFETSLR